MCSPGTDYVAPGRAFIALHDGINILYCDGHVGFYPADSSADLPATGGLWTVTVGD